MIIISKCRLCSDRDETINHLISESSKLAQKEYKTRHNMVGNVIHWEMWKKFKFVNNNNNNNNNNNEFKFDHTNKWNMHNAASVLKNDKHKLLWNFDIQTDHLISVRRPELIIINNKKKHLPNCRSFQLTTE